MQGRDHRRVHEPGVAALRALCRLVAGERVGEVDAGHGDAREPIGRHLAQLAIEFLVADEEAGVQDGLVPVRALDRALEDAGAHQREEAVDQQLRAAVEADLERSELGVRRQRRAERGQQRAELSVPGVAQDQGMRECIGERADADLQRAAVLDEGWPRAAPWHSP